MPAVSNPSFNFAAGGRSILGCLLAFTFLFSVAPVSGTARVVTNAGVEHVGHVETPELRMVLDDGGVVLLLRPSLDRIERRAEGGHHAIMKDGTELDGRLTADLVIDTGGVKRIIPPEEISAATFDLFVKLAGVTSVQDCPIRAEVEATDIVMGSVKRWRTDRTHRARCGETFVNSFEVERRRAVQEYVRAGEVPRKGIKLQVRPFVMIAHGTDQWAQLRVALVQGDRVLGSAATAFAAPEGDHTSGRPTSLWFDPDEVDRNGPPPALRFQLVTVDRELDREADPVWNWFAATLWAKAIADR